MTEWLMKRELRRPSKRQATQNLVEMEPRRWESRVGDEKNVLSQVAMMTVQVLRRLFARNDVRGRTNDEVEKKRYEKWQTDLRSLHANI